MTFQWLTSVDVDVSDWTCPPKQACLQGRSELRANFSQYAGVEAQSAGVIGIGPGGEPAKARWSGSTS